MRKTNKKSNKSNLRCENCLSIIGRGFRHKCTKRSLYGNASTFLSPKVGISLLKNADLENDTIRKETSLKNAGGGKDIPIIIGRKALRSYKKPDPIPVKMILNIKNTLMTSYKKTLDLAKEIRFATKNRKAIEPGLEKKLVENSEILNNFFSVEMVEIELNDGNKETRPLVYCNKLNDCLNFIKKYRNLQYFHLKTGIDWTGGLGFLKLTFYL